MARTRLRTTASCAAVLAAIPAGYWAAAAVTAHEPASALPRTGAAVRAPGRPQVRGGSTEPVRAGLAESLRAALTSARVASESTNDVVPLPRTSSAGDRQLQVAAGDG